MTSVRRTAGLASDDDITEGDATLITGEFAAGVPSDATENYNVKKKDSITP